ncbi:MAG: potassium transporter KtrB [Ruminococcaceae bacterium]|nr:potassium transporter KtrB [Oscillospiraceae bacterium]
MKKSKISFSTTHIILLSFFIAVLLGAVLLSLPISSATGEWTPFVDALFTSTTATCVTGLVVVPTFSAWSTFGHIVILFLIQIGGLGVITVVSILAMLFHKKMGLSDRLLLQDAFNLNTLSGLSQFVKKVVLGTFLVEGIGALLYMTVFIPDFGLKGIWISVFTAISAFCNAGIDIIAPDSLAGYVHNPIINLTTCLLIFFSGIGYIVWWDVIRVIKQRKAKKVKIFKALTLHSKIALATTLILIFGGALCIFFFEYNNPQTMRDFTLYQKIQASFFQSVTTRTAGFFTVPQENLSNGSALVSVLLMFIGGSPVGTAGGVKTVTIAVVVSAAISAIKNKNDVTMFNRTLSKQAVSKAIAVICTSFFIMFMSTLLLSAVTDASLLDILYETASATATVGLSRNLTATLNTLGKIIITATMYFGRVGPISLAVALNLKKQNPNIIKNPVEDISVG